MHTACIRCMHAHVTCHTRTDMHMHMTHACTCTQLSCHSSARLRSSLQSQRRQRRWHLRRRRRWFHLWLRRRRVRAQRAWWAWHRRDALSSARSVPWVRASSSTCTMAASLASRRCSSTVRMPAHAFPRACAVLGTPLCASPLHLHCISTASPLHLHLTRVTGFVCRRSCVCVPICTPTACACACACACASNARVPHHGV